MIVMSFMILSTCMMFSLSTTIGIAFGHRALGFLHSVAACRPQSRRRAVPIHGPRLQAHFEGVGAYRDTSIAFETW